MTLRVFAFLFITLISAPALANARCPSAFTNEPTSVFSRRSTVPSHAVVSGRTCVQIYSTRGRTGRRDCTWGRQFPSDVLKESTRKKYLRSTRRQDICIAFAKPGDDVYDPPNPSSSHFEIDVIKSADIPGSDYRSLRTTTPAQCAQRCLNALRCGAYSWVGRGGMCHLKTINVYDTSQRATLRFRRGIYSGVKINRGGTFNTRVNTPQLFESAELDGLHARVLRDAFLRDKFRGPSSGPTCEQICLKDERCDGYVEYHKASRCVLLKVDARAFTPNARYMRMGRDSRTGKTVTIKKRRGGGLTRSSGGRA